MRTFAGFPGGRLRMTGVPDLFFSELLPAIDDLAELKLTLHVIWRLARLQRDPRHLSLSELEEDGVLLGSLDPEGARGREVLQEALARCVTRGTLLRLQDAQGGQVWYFLNSEQGRNAYQAALRGEVQLAGAPSGEPVRPVVERPNIYQLYEQNIGLLQPLIADQLREAETTYPAAWIEEAFRIAAERNVRSWAYVRKVLERWAREGKDGGPPLERDRTRYIRGKYADRIKH
ncbi:MAG: DnaD domain protein [Anaerolineae bacterium]|nr:DnaD domain protein [Anaerolineae bacterium]